MPMAMSTAQLRTAPLFEDAIQFGGRAADLRAGDLQSAHRFEHIGDFTGGDALHIHLGQGELERAFAAQPFFQGGRIEVDGTAHLRHLKGESAQTRSHSFWFEAVGITQAFLGALIRSGIEGVGALGFHRFVDQQAEALGECVLLVVQKELQNRFDNVSLISVGRVFVHLCCA